MHQARFENRSTPEGKFIKDGEQRNFWTKLSPLQVEQLTFTIHIILLTATYDNLGHKSKYIKTSL